MSKSSSAQASSQPANSGASADTTPDSSGSRKEKLLPHSNSDDYFAVSGA